MNLFGALRRTDVITFVSLAHLVEAQLWGDQNKTSTRKWFYTVFVVLIQWLVGHGRGAGTSQSDDYSATA